MLSSGLMSWSPGGFALQEKAGVALYHGQNVVEIMRDARRQLAYSLHFLRLLSLRALRKLLLELVVGRLKFSRPLSHQIVQVSIHDSVFCRMAVSTDINWHAV